MYDMMPDAEPESETRTSLLPLARPAILVRAARAGAALYRRSRDLPQAVAGLHGGSRRSILARLAEGEARCEEERKRRAPGYRPSRHVQILAALMAEAA